LALLGTGLACHAFKDCVSPMPTLLYEAANVMLTRYKGQLKLKDWAFAIAKRSTMRKAKVALARRLAIIMHAMLRDGTEFTSA
jgi:transposase